jgi:MSHA biogenesis protein MshN
MSLINQMLQDLERRSAGNMLGGQPQPQVRAVPNRGGLHPAWWLVLALTLALGGVVLWLALRPTPPVVAPPNLALKIASDLGTLPSPVAQTPAAIREPFVEQMTAENPVMVTAPQRTTDVRQSDDAAVKSKNNNPLPISQRELTAQVNAPAVVFKPSAAPAATNAGSDESDKSFKLTKQVKELTSQQRAENDYRQASTALQQGRSSEAINDLEQALQLDPQHAAARQMQVGLLLQAKRTDDAVRLAQEGLALDPAQVGLAMILARVQVEQSDLKSALTTLDKSLPYAQDRADYQAFLAALLQRDKRHKDAIDHYVVAIGKAPQNGIWWMGLGISLQAENRLPEAKEAFNRAKSSNTLTPELLAFVNQKLTQLR